MKTDKNWQNDGFVRGDAEIVQQWFMWRWFYFWAVRQTQGLWEFLFKSSVVHQMRMNDGKWLSECFLNFLSEAVTVTEGDICRLKLGVAVKLYLAYKYHQRRVVVFSGMNPRETHKGRRSNCRQWIWPFQLVISKRRKILLTVAWHIKGWKG